MGNKSKFLPYDNNIQFGGDPPKYPLSANNIEELWNSIKYYSMLHKFELLYLLGLLVYIITIIFIFIYNPNDIVTDYNRGWIILLTILGGAVIIVAFTAYQKQKQLSGAVENTTVLNTVGKFLTFLFSTGFAVAIIYGLFVLGSHFTNFTTFLLFGLNTLIVVGLITLFVKYFGLHGDGGGGAGPTNNQTENKPSWMKLLLKVITYIPCLLLDMTDYIRQQYQITTKPIVIIFVVEIILISIYFTYQWIMEQVITHNSKQLLQQPVNLNEETNLDAFSNVNFVDDKFQYKYAISSWIYIDSFPPETNPKYEEYTSLLNIGNRPNILFNVAKNKLIIKMETAGKKEDIVYETGDFNMQRWNNIIINYDGATLDIFINNQLVSSTPGIIPYNDNTMMTTGTPRGISGGICNVNYFNENISKGKIDWLYNSVKHLNPPVI